MADPTKKSIDNWVHEVIHRAAERGEIDTGYFTSQRKLLELKKRFERTPSYRRPRPIHLH